MNTRTMLILYYILINLIGLSAMVIDKIRAMERRFRIPESVLLILALLGGSLGCIAGMIIFRHKKRKPKFRYGLPLILILQIGAWLAIVGPKAVGYHVHQVITTEAGFVNHTAITEPYGRLISYASFFRMWQDGEIAKAPMIFEMDGRDAYATTLAVFDKYR